MGRAYDLKPPLRLSPEDGKVYSFEEFRSICAAEYSNKDIQDYWRAECVPLDDHPIGRFLLRTLGVDDGLDVRRDPSSGEVLTQRRLRERCGQVSGEECRRRWRQCLPWWRPGPPRSSAESGEGLLADLCLRGIVRSEEVLWAMLRVDRWHYVPNTEEAYCDVPQQLGPDATVSAPHIHGQCLELLLERLQPGMQVLDVGSGSGYLSAVLARLVTRGGARGRVLGIDHLDALVELGLANARKADAELLASGALELRKGDGWKGWPSRAPFDAIHVGAGAPEVPGALLRQLRPGGRLLMPVGDTLPEPRQQLTVIDHLMNGSFQERKFCNVRYVPLVKPHSDPEHGAAAAELHAFGKVASLDCYEEVS